ncbi:uncharacterized protein LOC135102603 [Scylla paramamosain]|uniref:uncharacterized protein LOC135102603 n=1 Tax=Scylla paramamosain TaxID=85552 RepID=UPI00308296EE
MAFKALLTAALLAASEANSPALQEATSNEGRFFITGTGNPNQSVVVGNASLVLLGLLVAVIVAALIGAAFSGRGRELIGLKTPHFGSASNYESSYAVHRAIEENARKHE